MPTMIIGSSQKQIEKHNEREISYDAFLIGYLIYKGKMVTKDE